MTNNREIELLVEFHKNAERLGPGSPDQTILALNLLRLNKLGKIKIADIGCGTGAQTIILAQNTKSEIVAVDLFPDFLEKLEERALSLKLSDRIETMISPMENLPFEEGSFDLFWSEGAIYSMGFNEGINAWRPFLKNEGRLAVSEISWITDSRPKEIEDYWKGEYPQIDTISNKIRRLEKAGYTPLAHFILSDNAWTEQFYNPMKERFNDFLMKYPDDSAAKDLIDKEKEEFALYETYKEYFGYVFYLSKKG